MNTNQMIDLVISLALVAFVIFMHWQMNKNREIINKILGHSINRDFLLREARHDILIQYFSLPFAIGFALWRFYALLESYGAQGAGFYGLIAICAGYCFYQMFYYVPALALAKHHHLLGNRS